ncbi:MAG: ABC transporter ATP-binding protein [Candidatus Shapirobacteria bacterium]|jgi:ABC-type polysaccharide/polyol phosphate transport system ATPase subunit
MPTHTIVFENVTKKFQLQNHKTFKELLPAILQGKSAYQPFTALNNISFSVEQGTALGIIGSNGSGKSTILKLIAKVMTPTSGQITVDGTVSPLIELGAGFHPELSGKENIYLNASILGLTRKDIDANYDQIIHFSELGQFIDQPIKHYSSGMYMRLAFSIAIHVNPSILLIDEILTVGDLSFQAKCYAKMEEYKRKGVTIVFVTHDLNLVRDFCHQVIYMRNSEISFQGEPVLACQKYQNDQNPL